MWWSFRPNEIAPVATSVGIVLSAVALPAVGPPLCAQRLPYEQGDRVRIAYHDPAAAGVWRAGVVLWPARDHVVLRIQGQLPVEYVPFGDRIRIQVQRGRHSKPALAAVAGGVVGAFLGVTVFRSSFDFGEADATVTGVVLYGAIGGVLGGLIGKQISPPKWVDVPVVNGRVRVAPLTVPHIERRPFTKVYRWERFPPTVPDFEAFFRSHADSLDHLEGIWARVGAAPDLAIVREPGLEGYAYAGFLISRLPDGASLRSSGLMIMGLTRPAPDGLLEVRRTRDARRVPAEINGPLLMIRPVGDAPEQWVRVVP
jgi:hypothetical protein